MANASVHSAPPFGAVTDQAAGDQLARILRSPTFVNSPRLSRLLDYLVRHSLEGEARELQEYAIAIAVFNRGSGFDPQKDTIVRVTARRLRDRLQSYYKGEGRADAVLFQIPKGHYRVEFLINRTAGSAYRALGIAACVLVLVAIAGWLAKSPVDDPVVQAVSSEVAQELQLGRHFFSRRAPGDTARALEKFQRVVAINPGLADAWVGIAGCLMLQASEGTISTRDSMAGQQAALTTALTVDPAHAEAHARMYKIQYKLGRIDLAERHLEQAMHYGSDSALTQSIISSHYRKSGDLQSAIIAQRRAANLEPLGFVYLANLADLLYEAGYFEESLAIYQEAHMLSPELSATLQDARLHVLILLGRYHEGEAALLQLPEGVAADQGRALLYHAYGDKDEAEAALNALSARTDLEAVARLAEVFAFRGETEKAMAQLQLTYDLAEQEWGDMAGISREMMLLYHSPFMSVLQGNPRWLAWWQSRRFEIAMR